MIPNIHKRYSNAWARFAYIIILNSLIFLGTAGADEFAPKIDPNKFTICTATINSSNEKAVFEEVAASNKERFNPIVELTDFGDDWFKKACESHIRCDQLVISGHFGGNFFGESGLSLKFNELEDQSCSRTCEGIMSSPLEVFLFGCNTLATKAKDSRSPEEYLNALLTDRIPRAQADAIVESRYGITDDDNKTRMARAFSGKLKNIYGFSSIAPSGEHVESYLRNYFKSINPAQRLATLKKNRFLKAPFFENSLIAKSLRLTSFDQITVQNSITRDKPSELMCTLRSTLASVDERINSTVEALHDPKYLRYIPSINSFFTNSPVEKMSDEQRIRIKNISAEQSLATNLLLLIRQTKSFYLLSEWAMLLETVGVYKSTDIQDVIGGKVHEMLNRGLVVEDRDAICSIDPRLNLILDWRKIFQGKTFSLNDLKVIECQKGFSSETSIVLLEKFEETNDSRIRYKISEILKEHPSSNQLVINKTLTIIEKFAKENFSLHYLVKSLAVIQKDDVYDQIRLLSIVPEMEPATAHVAIVTLDEIGSTNSDIVRRVLDILHYEDVYTRIPALYFLKRVKSSDEFVQNEIVSNYEREQSKEVKNLSATVLESTRLTEPVQLRMIELIKTVKRTSWQPEDLIYMLKTNKSILTDRAILKLKLIIKGLPDSEQIKFNEMLGF